MFVRCEENSLAFEYHNIPKFNKNTFDTDFCYFMKIPTPENNFEVDFTRMSSCFLTGKI